MVNMLLDYIAMLCCILNVVFNEHNYVTKSYVKPAKIMRVCHSETCMCKNVEI